jgi:hypothetical protein
MGERVVHAANWNPVMAHAVERFVFNTTDHPKRIADLLLKSQWQLHWKRSDAQEAIALVYGHPTWFNLLQASKSGEPPSLFDENSLGEQVKVRHIHQVRALAIYTIGKPLGIKGTELLPFVNKVEQFLSLQEGLPAAYSRHIERAIALVRQITPTQRARPRSDYPYQPLPGAPAYLELDKMAARAAAWLRASGWNAHAEEILEYAPTPHNSYELIRFMELWGTVCEQISVKSDVPAAVALCVPAACAFQLMQLELNHSEFAAWLDDGPEETDEERDAMAARMEGWMDLTTQRFLALVPGQKLHRVYHRQHELYKTLAHAGGAMLKEAAYSELSRPSPERV